MKTKIGYLVDPVEKTVVEVVLSNDYRAIYPLLKCDTYDVVNINDDMDGIFVDDEGLFKDDPAFFQFDGCPSALAGRGLLLGCYGETGESRPRPVISLEDFTKRVRFEV